MSLQTIRPRLATVDTRRVTPPPKQKDAVYYGPAFNAWRAAIIKRDGYRCRICGTREGRLYADHVEEVRDGGAPYDPTNGQLLCATHHGLKTAEARARRAAR